MVRILANGDIVQDDDPQAGQTSRRDSESTTPSVQTEDDFHGDNSEGINNTTSDEMSSTIPVSQNYFQQQQQRRLSQPQLQPQPQPQPKPQSKPQPQPKPQPKPKSQLQLQPQPQPLPDQLRLPLSLLQHLPVSQPQRLPPQPLPAQPPQQQLLQQQQQQQGAIPEELSPLTEINQQLVNMGFPVWYLGNQLVEPVMSIVLLFVLLSVGIRGLFLIGLIYIISRLSDQ